MCHLDLKGSCAWQGAPFHFYKSKRQYSPWIVPFGHPWWHPWWKMEHTCCCPFGHPIRVISFSFSLWSLRRPTCSIDDLKKFIVLARARGVQSKTMSRYEEDVSTIPRLSDIKSSWIWANRLHTKWYYSTFCKNNSNHGIIIITKLCNNKKGIPSDFCAAARSWTARVGFWCRCFRRSRQRAPAWIWINWNTVIVSCPSALGLMLLKWLGRSTPRRRALWSSLRALGLLLLQLQHFVEAWSSLTRMMSKNAKYEGVSNSNSNPNYFLDCQNVDPCKHARTESAQHLLLGGNQYISIPARCRSPHPSRVRGSPHPFSKKGRGGPFFEKINTAMVRGATERRP